MHLIVYFRISKMDLQGDVKKATLLPLADQAKFYQLQGLCQADKDRKMNERRVKTPRNLILLEDDTDDSAEENDINNKLKSTFDKHGISAAIKEVNGGVDLSNKHWESYWAKHLEQIMKSNINKSCELSLHKSTEVNSGDQSELKSSENHKSIKPQNKIFRNAAIMGLVNTKKISLEDLTESNSKRCAREEDRLKTLDTETDNEYQVEFVPLAEDPEIYIHPLRMGIDVKRFGDIDFTVPSVGKKIKETPQQYFLRTTTDDSFEFVKKDKSTV